MKLVFVSGPYRAVTEYAVKQNIRRAEDMALRVWQAGAAALCPHLNTALWGGACPDSTWLKGDLEMLRRCDAIMLVSGWENSSGARDEVAAALTLGLPVFESFDQFLVWLNHPDKTSHCHEDEKGFDATLLAGA